MAGNILRHNTIKAVMVLAITAFILPGCVTMDSQVAGGSSGGRIDQMQEDLQKLKRTVDEHVGKRDVELELSERVAQLGARVDQFERDIQLLKGKSEELERTQKTLKVPKATPDGKLKAMSAQVADLTTRVDTLSTQLTARRTALAKPSLEEDPKAPSKKKPVADLSKKGAKKAPSQDPRKLYDSGYNLYRKGSYAEARKAFQSYIKSYPDTTLTDNAYFWIGEAYYNEGSYEKAIILYDKIVREFKSGDKVPSALLKQAFAFDALGDEPDARIVLKRVIKEFPQSEQASVARRKLEVIGQ